MQQTFMKEKKILPLVISMSLPMVISMAVNSMYNIVDSYFVAMMSEDAMTALALVYPVQNLITAIGVGFGVGINAAVAFYLGAEDDRLSAKASSMGLGLSVLHGIILTIVTVSCMPFFIGMFSSSKAVVELSLIYSNRAFMFSIIITTGIAFEKIFQAAGKMKITMVGMMCGFIANIVLDPLLIFGVGVFPKLGIAGAAYATGIGQTLTLIVYIAAYRIGKLPVKLSLRDSRPEAYLVKRLYAVGIPATLNMALPSLLISALNGILAGFSQGYVLVLGVYYKLQTFIYLTANGIIQGIRPLIGYNYGAGEIGRVRSIYVTALYLAAVVMAVGTVFSWVMPDVLIGFFTSNEETVKIGVEALHVISFGFIVSAVSITASGTLEGLGKGTASLYISLSRYMVVIIPAAFLMSRAAGASGVWLAFPIAEFITAAFAYCIYRREMKKIDVHDQEAEVSASL